MTTALAVQSVAVDGWTAYDHPQPPTDDFGNIWVWETISGWYGGLSPRGAPVARPLLDGDFDGSAPFGGRTIELGGTLVAPSRQALQQGMDALAGVLARQVRRSALVVTEGVVPLTRQCQVRLGGPTLIDRTGPTSAKWSVSLYAPDPMRYSLDQHYLELTPYVGGTGRSYSLTMPRTYGPAGLTGSGLAVNNGSTPTPLLVSFYGSASTPTLTILGGGYQQLLVTLVDETEMVQVDSGARTVQLAGASRRQYLSSGSSWLYIPPGITSLFYDTALPGDTGRCVISWWDAWS